MYTQGQQQALAQFGLKTAARRGVKIIRDLARTNNPQDLERANRLATTPGVVKDSPTGSFLKFLSRQPSAEGPAALVAHPRHGVATAVIPDDRGLTTPSLLSARRRLGDTGHPSATKILGTGHYEGLNHPVVHREYVPGELLANVTDRRALLSADNQKRSLGNAALKRGLVAGDMHDGNVIVRPDGVAKVIDPAPYPIGTPGPLFRPTTTMPVRIDPLKSWQSSMDRLQGGDYQLKGLHPKQRAIPAAPRAGLDEFARKAEARDAARAPAPKVDEKQRMIEEFLAKKRQAAR